MLAATAGLYIGFGLVARSLAPVVSDVQNDLGLNRSQMGAVLGAWQFVYLFAAIPAGKMLDRFGLRAGLGVGIALITLSGLLRAQATGWTSLLVAVGVFGFGGPLVSVGAPTLVSNWFSSEERGLATGIAVSGPVIGSMITLLTANSLLMPAFDNNWRPTVLAFAAAAGISGLLFLLVTSRPPPTVADPWHRPVKGRVLNAELLSVPIVRTVLIMAIFTFFVNHAVASWLPEILRDQGLSASRSGFWAAMVSVPGLVAGILIPRNASAERRHLVLVGCFLLLGAGLAPLLGPWGPGSAAGILLYGAMRSAVLPVAMLFLMDHPRVGPANMAGAAALYFTAGEVGGVTGPVAVGIIADRSGFGASVGLLLAVAVLLCGLATTLRASSEAESDSSQRSS